MNTSKEKAEKGVMVLVLCTAELEHILKCAFESYSNDNEFVSSLSFCSFLLVSAFGATVCSAPWLCNGRG